ncbi:MAG: hypothetical protein HOE62_03125 [Alphaproteobacteria bacterium]|jgi:hypothetical protein|nr:hypothetical protein [Alphaproteobacteria bacterium]MBT4016917.1 hypothetical protein [Alphaproteobacteria bacterium]MBT4964945.1 hypothetical protein [Alphaproteobacteria bacterium]MBT5161756.1 hypothetical protein [Alphaproteobacteria bacterium]MBT5918875.1 hypothetical protein [Alphaproteobacteria bacterium]
MAIPDAKTVVSTTIKLVVVSLLVGWGLTVFDITPQQLLADLGGTIKSIFEVFVDLFRWVVSQFGGVASYILLGAVVVIPIWVVLKLLTYVKERK